MTVPFQNLAISAGSKGSVLILSIFPEISGLLTTIPLGSNKDILVTVKMQPTEAALLR